MQEFSAPVRAGGNLPRPNEYLVEVGGGGCIVHDGCTYSPGEKFLAERSAAKGIFSDGAGFPAVGAGPDWSRVPVGEGFCGPHTERCANAREYSSETAECCREIRRALVEYVAGPGGLLASQGVTFWADYGTLLGAVRNPLTTWENYSWLPQDGRSGGPLSPGMLPHDKDDDLGILSEDLDLVLALDKPLRRFGMRMRISGRGTIKLLCSRMNETNIDLFPWYRQPETGMRARREYCSVDAFKGKEFREEELIPLSMVEWEGISLPAPRDPAAWCEFRYGPGWKTPIAANNDGVRR